MFKKILVTSIILGVVPSMQALADDSPLAVFNGGIGVLGATSGSIRGVVPAGAIWAIDSLSAKVRTNGRINVTGTGLIFGSGNNAGRSTLNFVAATFICENSNTAAQFSTPARTVTLSLTGDFKIDDVLSPPPPLDCASPMLLIRNGGSATNPALGGWFAVGILDPLTGSRGDKDED